MQKPAKLFSAEQYQIEDSVGYLLTRSRAKLGKSVDAALAAHDITGPQGGIILMLSTGRYTTAAELARELFIDSASITRMTDRLEKRGLIMRVRREDDRRVIDLRLTPDGQHLAQQLPTVFAGVLCRNFAGFTAEEVGSLKSLLRKFLAVAGTDSAADAFDETS